MKFLPELFNSNRVWARQQIENDPTFFSALCNIHNPDLLWIGCSDSRVPANNIVGRAPGELFVHRNIANIVPLSDVNVMAVIDYAVNALKVKHIIVCGHYHCGGVMAFLKNEHRGIAGLWLQQLHTVAEQHAHELDNLQGFPARWQRLCELNVMAQVRNVSLSEVVLNAWDKGKSLAIHGWIYDLSDGLLRDLEVTEGFV